MRVKNLLKLILFIALILGCRITWAEEEVAEQKAYNPWPIIFVHGYNVKDTKESLWKDAREGLEEYFVIYSEIGEKESKYPDENWENYLNCFDYRTVSNGDLGSQAPELKGFIDKVLDKTGQEKVIIVAHSAGGLITRRMLTMYPECQEKIEKVVFVGTPHNGSPLASGVILIDRMIPQLEEALKQAGKWGLLSFDLKSYGIWWPYNSRYRQIKKTLDLYNTLVNWNFKITVKDMLAGSGNPYRSKQPHNQGQGVAVGQLVVPENVTAEKTFSEKLMFGPFKVAEAAPLTISASYAKTDTFLNNNAFAIPNKFAIIEGTGSLGAWFMGNGSASIFTKLAGLTFEGLPANNDFNDLDAGDGIVTPSSQTGIAGNENCEAVYEVEATHLTECSDWQTILQAIDDKPEIESVEAHYTPPMFGCNLSIKLKDYLLADIEIAEIMIDGEKMDLSSIPRMDEFYDEESGVYKPYKKYGSDFLKERGGIMQGEFGISFPMGNRIDIKIRNAGGKTAECTLFIPSEYAVKSGDGSAESHFGDEQSWSDVKEQAYSILWKNLDWTYNNGFREKIICGSIESWSFHQDHVIGDNWFTMCKAVIAETLDCKINFKLDIDNRQVKSIKFVGIGRKNMRKRKRTREVQTKEDFTILACKGNNLLSRIETDSFDNGDKIEIDINPQDINLNGNNILEFRPNFSAYNAIINPPSLTSPLIEHDCVMCRESGTSYSRTAEIYYPCLVVTYEDEAEEKEE